MSLRHAHPSGNPALVLFVLALAWCAPWGVAAAQDAAPAVKSESVPLKKIVLFNAGVGYFEHGGQVEGDATVDLRFNVDDINDLLKSMVLQDLGGGNISTVTYASRDPVTRALQTFSIDLTQSPSLADLLRQIRGEKVDLEIEGTPKPERVEGTILGVETRKKPVGDKGELVDVDMLSLLTQFGLRNVRLDNVNTIRLVNPKLNDELQQALAILATSHSTDRKTVTLAFQGKGRREVRVGYIQETPIWKTSYRLVLGDEQKPYLQGWAIVENTTEEDWNNVDLTLISGRPISFRMDLYQPLYVTRPLVVPELFASLLPRTYDQDLGAVENEFRANAKAAAAPSAGSNALADANRAVRKADSLADEKGAALRGRRAAEPQMAAANLQASLPAVAQAGDVGELFQYRIDAPVTLARQKSAMLPIVNANVEGEKLSLFNERVHPKHPLNGLRMKNSTELHLMQGPITVFDDGAYAGDARIEDLPPKSERLISYAMDLDVEVAAARSAQPEQLLSVRLNKGVLSTSRKSVRTTKYTVKNSSRKPRSVLVEHPVEPNWSLVEPKEVAEKTRDLYRIPVKAAPGEPIVLTVVEEMTHGQSVALTNIDDGTIAYYLSATVVSEPIKQALREVIRQKQLLADAVAERQRLAQRITVIEQEQNRIRQNMAQLDRTNELYGRYVKKFAEQEDLNDQTRAAMEKLNTKEADLRKQLDAYLLQLELN